MFLLRLLASLLLACLAYSFPDITINSDSNLVDTITSVRANVDIEEYRQGVLDCMNQYRAKHQVGPLKRTDFLTDLAQDWAQHLIDTNKFEHRGGVGENLWGYWTSGNNPPTAAAPCQSWYSEEKDYDYVSGEPAALHFTAMVWKASTEAGVGLANLNGNYIVVVDFAPTGNVIGAFKENVLPPK